MGSLNHSLVSGRIIGLLFNNERLRVLPEISLDVSQIDLQRFNLKTKDELVPDICVYLNSPPMPNKEIEDDILSVSQMPDLAIEVLSPRQSVEELVMKIKAFFALGIKSCWLVIPANESMTVYTKPDAFRLFSSNDLEVVDEVMDIHLPVKKIFW